MASRTAALQSEIERLRAQLDYTSLELRASQDTIAALRTTITDSKAQITALEDTVATLTVKLRQQIAARNHPGRTFFRPSPELLARARAHYGKDSFTRAELEAIA